MSVSAFFTTSVVSGWQLLQLNNPNLTSIAELSYDSGNRQLVFGPGAYILTVYTSMSTAYLIGMQSFQSATTPTSLTNPELDTFAYVRTSNARPAHALTFLYRFSVATPVRFYLNSSGATTLSAGEVNIVRLS